MGGKMQQIDDMQFIDDKVDYDPHGVPIDQLSEHARKILNEYCSSKQYVMCQSSAQYVTIDQHYDYTYIEIAFKRLETETEYHSRKKLEEQSQIKKQKQQEKEIKQLETLAKKLGKRVI